MGDRLGIQVAVDIAFWDRARSGVSVTSSVRCFMRRPGT